MSDWRESANKRRDERQTKVEPRAHARRKPNRKKWCKGKVGIPHKAVWQKRRPWVLPSGTDVHKNDREYVCAVCKKVLDYWWKGWNTLMGSKTPKPRLGSTNPEGT